MCLVSFSRGSFGLSGQPNYTVVLTPPTLRARRGTTCNIRRSSGLVTAHRISRLERGGPLGRSGRGEELTKFFGVLVNELAVDGPLKDEELPDRPAVSSSLRAG
jgi:hypothetical protein